jgi:hypothetical protein
MERAYEQVHLAGFLGALGWDSVNARSNDESGAAARFRSLLVRLSQNSFPTG